MTTDPTYQQGSSAAQITTPKQFQLSVELEDIDQAINDYMIDVIVPELKEDGKTLKVPIIYGNAERWKSIQKDGYFRDSRGMIQIPLIMFKRTSVDKDDALKFFSRNVTYPSVQKYSKKNRYDRFSLLNEIKPTYQSYDVVMPEYVMLNYEIVMWTHYTEHMNKLIEAYRHAAGNYWGDKDKFKFRTIIDSFDTQQDVTNGTERIIKTNFNLDVRGYLLPAKFNNKPTTKKSHTVQKVNVTTETDLTGNPINRAYHVDSETLQFIFLKNNDVLEYQSDNIFTLNNIELVTVPAELQSTYPNTEDLFTLYVNGLHIASDAWSVVIDNNTATFEFNEIETGFIVNNNDEVNVIGKYNYVVS